MGSSDDSPFASDIYNKALCIYLLSKLQFFKPILLSVSNKALGVNQWSAFYDHWSLYALSMYYMYVCL